MLWKWRAPNPATKCMQLLCEHHCITFQLHIQRKDESFKACRFGAPAECTLTVSQNFHSGGGVRPNLVRLKKNACTCARRLVGEPATLAVWCKWLGCFFLSTKKSLSARMQRARAIARAGSMRLVLRA